MFGNNPKRPPVKNDGKKLQIVEIFKTLQGEAIFAGYPAVFIRLGGCNLACDFCDTEFEEFSEISVIKIIKKTQELSLTNGRKTHNLVVITGGEPMRQPIEYLCNSLLLEGFKVQIETNGTIYRPLNKQIYIVCSPKNISGKYAPINKQINISAYKYIVSATHQKYKYIPDNIANDIPIYIQPMDEQCEQKNIKNMQYAAKLAEEKGLLLSLQLHKIIGIA